MPVVIGASNIAPRSRGGAGYADPQALAGIRRIARGTVTNLASDNTLSRYFLTDLPSDCYIDVGTVFKVDTWGYATVNLGTETNPTAFGSVLRSAGATWSPVGAIDARRWQELWQALGLAANPGGRIALFLHATADATGAGSCNFNFEYVDRV